MYIVVRFNINASTGAEAHSIQKFDDKIAAMKRYYTLLASDIDNENYLYELVQVVPDDGGLAIASQVFDNRPAPAPEIVQ